MGHLLAIYRANFRVTIATQLQYRASLLIWLLGTILEPTIYLVVWRTIARSGGGSVGGYSAGDFAAYFLVLMLVNHLTFSWIMWEYEYRIRQGQFSPLLLRPVHPIHKDIADNIAYKLIALPALLPTAALLAVAFRAAADPAPWALAAFVPALLLAFLVRFLIEWTLAMSAFWTTRTGAVNQVYFVTSLFLSGQVAPLDLMPAPVRVAASLLPFRWAVAFPVELALGRLTPREALLGFAAQGAWIIAGVALLVAVWRVGVRRYSGVGA
jgi:ABC-2 type transport system permease protein